MHRVTGILVIIWGIHNRMFDNNAGTDLRDRVKYGTLVIR